MFSRFALVSTLLLALPATSSFADDIHRWEYDHFREHENASRRFDIRPGAFVDVVIRNSPPGFRVSYFAAPSPPEASEKPVLPGINAQTALDELLAHAGIQKSHVFIENEQTISIPHRAGYGGYVVRIEGPRGEYLLLQDELQKERLAAKAETLRNASQLPTEREAARNVISRYASIMDVGTNNLLLLVSEDPSWRLAGSAGIWLSSLVDRKFAAQQETTNGAVSTTLRREKKKEDDAAFGVATFLQVVPPAGWHYLAVGAGLGIDDAKRVSLFFPTLSWRLGDIGFLSCGMQSGSISIAPSGLREGDKITDANVLTSLDHRRVCRFFLAFSLLRSGGDQVPAEGPILAPPTEKL